MIRGNDRQRIFEEHDDYVRFIQIMDRIRKETGFTLYAWCLMPNHVHILLREKGEPLSSVVQRIEVRYVTWYNMKYNRSGHLFQGRFRSEAVEDEVYFLRVFRYIHMNPVTAGICGSPELYPYSSYSKYFSGDNYSDEDVILGYMPKKEFVEYHMEKCTDSFLDEDPPKIRRLTDDIVCGIVRDSFGIERISVIQTLPKSQRNMIIDHLLRKGASIRQLNRLTGVSVTIIREIKKESAS